MDSPLTTLSPVIQKYDYLLNESLTDVTLTSPGFQSNYPAFSDITMTIMVPIEYNVIIRFLHFDLEYSDRCEFDNVTLSSNNKEIVVRCGDWNDRLKQLEWISDTNMAIICLRTDGSINRSGFRLKASLYRCVDCNCNGKNVLYHGPRGCLTTYFDDKVTYQQAAGLCENFNASLISNGIIIDSYLLRRLALIDNDKGKNTSQLVWVNDSKNDGNCLALDIHSTVESADDHQTKLKPVSCDDKLAFVCNWTRLEPPFKILERHITNDEGVISMIDGENEDYHNKVLLIFNITAPVFHKIVLEILYLDIEYQNDCGFDVLRFTGFTNLTKLCGNFTNRKMPLYFTSISNYATISFQSDDNILGHGFKLQWSFVNTIPCFDIAHNESIGVIQSFNFRRAFLDSRHCCSDINIGVGLRMIVDIKYMFFAMHSSCVSIIYSPNGDTTHFCGDNLLQDPFLSPIIISSTNVVSFCVKAETLLSNDGFKATYTADSTSAPNIENNMILHWNSTGQFSSPHYPQDAPNHIKQTTKLVAPIGTYIQLNITYTNVHNNCSDSSLLEIRDETLKSVGNTIDILNVSCSEEGEELVVIQSYLNNLQIIFTVAGDESPTTRTRFNASFVVVPDDEYLSKTKQFQEIPFQGCSSKSCLNNGICNKTSNRESVCSCPLHYTGMFCQVTWCEVPVCQHGVCSLNQFGYQCSCDRGFWGIDCNMTSDQCADKLCSGNGVCIKDVISNKTCSCNIDWMGSSCNVKRSLYVIQQTKQSLMSEPIWVGMIAVLALLLLFGVLFLSRQRCSRHFKCCEDTNSILKKQAENAIPAHENYIPSPNDTSGDENVQDVNFKVEIEDASNFLTVDYSMTSTLYCKNQKMDEREHIRTPPVDCENIDAAARLFKSYNHESEKPYLNKQPSILSYENPSVTGIVDGKLQFLQHDTEIQSSDNENVNRIIPFSNSELRKSFTSLPNVKKENYYTFPKSRSLHTDFEHRPHVYPKIVIMNDYNNELESAEHDLYQSNVQYEGKQTRRKSIHRQKTYDESDAKRKREAFALKSKSSGTTLEMPHFESNLAIRRACSNQERCRRSPCVTPTSFESDPTYLPTNKRIFLTSFDDSGEDDMYQRTLMRSFCSNPDDIQSMPVECKCCGKSLKYKYRKPKYYRASRARSRHHRVHASSDHSSSFENKRKPHRNHSKKSHLEGNKYESKDLTRTKNLDLKRREHETAKRVSLHIIEGDRDVPDDFCKRPVRKSRSNDLNLNKASLLVSPLESPFRRRCHSFHSETSDARRSQHPDDLLNEDQKLNSICQDNKQYEENSNKPDDVFLKQPNNIPPSSLSITDTDTGFSSSSPWRETTEETIQDKSRKQSVKDSAYQTKQSSIEKFHYECPKNSYENPEYDSIGEQNMTKTLQQAAKKLVLYETNFHCSKDSAFTNTFSEADDTGSCDSDTSPRELHPAVRPRNSGYNYLFPKVFPLEQVSEEADISVGDSVAVSDEPGSQSHYTEDIEMKEFNV